MSNNNETELMFGQPTIEDEGVYTHLQGTFDESTEELEQVFRSAGVRVFVLEVT